MLDRILALLVPLLILMVVLFLVFRLRFFSAREIGGRYPFVAGGILAFLTALWETVEMLPDYTQWFVVSAYPAIELVQFVVLVIGVLLMVTGVALYADFWQTRREEIELRQGKLSILENLQHDARHPYHLLELLNISLRETLVHFPSAAGAIFLVNRSRRQFVLTSSVGLTKNETALLEYYPLERNVVSQAVELGDPLLTSRFDFIDRSGSPVGSRFNSCLILPLTSGMEKIGGLLLFSEDSRFFGRGDVRCLTPVAQWLAEKIRSARLARELSQATSEVEKHVAGLSDMISRFASASKAVVSRDTVTMFCRSLVGLASSESAHLCGLKQGDIVFYGGSEPLFDISENFKTALIDAIGSTKPLIINQEAFGENDHQDVVLSSFVFPLGTHGSQDALLLLRSEQPFAVDQHALRQMEGFANIARWVLRNNEYQRLDLTRRKGFDAVLRLLKADEHPGSFLENPGYLLRHLAGVLPQGSDGLLFVRGEQGVLRMAAGAGGGERLPEGSLEIHPGEGGVGRVAADRESLFVAGRSNVARHFEAYHDANRSQFQQLRGERSMPDFIACCPILTGSVVAGVMMVLIYALDESERGEWERLLTLAAGLYSLRLTMEESQTGGTVPLIEGVESRSLGSVANELNNHFSAIIGTAELVACRSEVSGEISAQLKQIVDETERAAGILKETVLSGEVTERGDRGVEAAHADGLGSLARSVLATRHISGELYMADRRPREIRLKPETDEAVGFSNEKMCSLLESVLDRFASIAEEEDVITVATYSGDDHVYLDVSRHRRNFPPVEQVAGFGRYHASEEAFRSRPGDVYLSHLAGTGSYYAVDQGGTIPAYLSFKFPVRSGSRSPLQQDGRDVINLLVIDDQPVILDLILAMGQSQGYRVTTALSGEEGLRMAENGRFDVILTDLSLPGMSGLEFSRRIRPLQPDIPLILVTGWEANLEKSQLASAGISDVLYKPFRIEQLIDVVQAAVSDLSQS